MLVSVLLASLWQPWGSFELFSGVETSVIVALRAEVVELADVVLTAAALEVPLGMTEPVVDLLPELADEAVETCSVSSWS